MRLADRLRTTTFLLTLRYMVLFFVALTILLGFINFATVNYLERETRNSINADLRGLAELGRRVGTNAIAQVIAARVAANPGGDSIYIFANQDFDTLVGNVANWPVLQTASDGWVEFDIQNEAGRSIPAIARVYAPRPERWLLVGRQLPGLEALGGLLDTTLVLGLGITLLLAFAAGFLMSGNVVRRVQTINETSRQIMAGDLSQRVPARGTRDEFDELAVNLNAMLDQIESLMSSIRHMSDNVAHDLRTPLTRLRNRLENLQREVPDAEKDKIEACLADADGLLATFASLLSIARIESGTMGGAEPVDLAQVVADACDLYQAVAEEKSIDLRWHVEPGLKVHGDRNLIFQACTNLLDNAIKYAGPDGHIDVTVDTDDGQPRLVVGDSGPGIPEAFHEKVLDQFFRLDESRSEPGSGLGLSLVRAIALRHKAELSLADNQPGLRVTLVFPAPAMTGPARPADATRARDDTAA